MDTLTHALSGALAAQAVAKMSPQVAQLSQRARILSGFAAAAFPDIDFVLRFIDPLLYLNQHRGVTHSLVLLPFWAIFLCFIFAALSRGRYQWRNFFLVACLSIAIHIFGDLITSWGTMIFAPFSDVKLALPFTFIIDPYFTAIILLALLLSLRWQAILVARIGLLALLSYVCCQAWLHDKAYAVAQSFVISKDMTPAQISILPQPLSPFYWKLIVSHGPYYYVANLDLASTQKKENTPAGGFFARLAHSYQAKDFLEWRQYSRFGNPRQQSFARQAWLRPEFAAFRRFAAAPVLTELVTTSEERCAWFYDLRFTLSARPTPFIYGSCYDADSNVWRLKGT